MGWSWEAGVEAEMGAVDCVSQRAHGPLRRLQRVLNAVE